MLIILKSGSEREELDRVVSVAHGLGCETERLTLADRPALRLSGYREFPHPDLFETLAAVERVLPVMHPVRKVARLDPGQETRIRIGEHTVGNGRITLIAGPCAVESEEQLISVARRVREAGAHLLRGGAYKPRTSPYDFQGLGEQGLRLLARARQATGLPIVTEAVDEASVDLVEEYGDVIQIGARNMQNFQLLKRVGRSKLPVLLKRGMSASLEDLLLSAEYILDAGNPNVMLCERGIRTFSNHSRYTLDLSIVPVLKRVSHLPVLVDPSHASGSRESVGPLAHAALAAGADGLMIEVHPDPLHAMCDGPQSMPPDEFAALAASLAQLEPLVARQRETVS